MSPSELQAQWPFAKVELGLSRSEFDGLTVREFLEMVELWQRKQERADRRVARVLCAISLTVPRKEGTKLPTEDDFMPRKRTEPERVELDDDELYQKFQALSASLDNGKA